MSLPKWDLGTTCSLAGSGPLTGAVLGSLLLQFLRATQGTEAPAQPHQHGSVCCAALKHPP